MLVLLKAPCLVLHFSYYTLMTFLMIGIFNKTIYGDDITLNSKSDQASDLWQQQQLHFQLEYDLQYIVDWGRKWLVYFNAWKTQLVFICPI